MITDNVYPVDGRVVQILANDGCDLAGIRLLQEAIISFGAAPHVVATHKGAIVGARRRDELTVDRSFHTASSAEADALIVAHGANLADDPAVITYVQSAYRHFKPIAAWGDGEQLLANAGVDSSRRRCRPVGKGHQSVRQGGARRPRRAPPLGSRRNSPDSHSQNEAV